MRPLRLVQRARSAVSRPRPYQLQRPAAPLDRLHQLHQYLCTKSTLSKARRRAAKSPDLYWKASIVDLLKLLGLESSQIQFLGGVRPRQFGAIVPVLAVQLPRYQVGKNPEHCQRLGIGKHPGMAIHGTKITKVLAIGEHDRQREVALSANNQWHTGWQGASALQTWSIKLGWLSGIAALPRLPGQRYPDNDPKPDAISTAHATHLPSVIRARAAHPSPVV